MKSVLIVSPHFPPLNAPDMHRVRMSLPHYEECGWRPYVLAVKADVQEEAQDPSLLDLVPSHIPVTTVGALPVRLTRTVGIGNVGLRAYWPLYRAGAALLRRHKIDLVYFSTTMFAVMSLGRLWKARLGVPFVVDMQDPWFSDYYETRPHAARPPKHAVAQRMHQVLERWTMRAVDGVIAVSPGYVETLRRRYPWIDAERCAIVPFGASARDFEGIEAARLPPQGAGCRGVYVGAGGPAMSAAARIVCRALGLARARSAAMAAVRVAFVGTSYAPAGRAQKSIEPIAVDEQVAAQVHESTDRIGYRAALTLLRQSDFLVVLGSDDPQYSASKIYPYLLAGRPIVAVLHQDSPVVDLVRRSRAGVIVTFASDADIEGPAARLSVDWQRLVEQLATVPPPDLEPMRAFLAPALTRRQCEIFDAVCGVPHARAEPACAG